MSPEQPPAKLYVILGSHACRTGMLLLEHKGIPYRTVTIPTGAQRFLRPGGTVPTLVLGGERVQGNRRISRFLENTQADPPLFPSDTARRREVLAAEQWGDEVFQMDARRITLGGSLHGVDNMVAYANDGRLGPLLWHRARARRVGVAGLCRFVFNVNEHTERKLLDRLPEHLDRIDAWIDAGVLNGERLNAADYMIATSLALILYRRDLRPQIDPRPAGALAERVLPEPESVAAFAAA